MQPAPRVSASDFETQLSNASSALRAGGIVAYPTEYCFGLGCDPRNEKAVERLLAIKQRSKDQGVILIAADLAQVSQYANLQAVPNLSNIERSWPGPNTWLLPALQSVPEFVRGRHKTIAMRIPGHEFCRRLLMVFGHPIVSSSANRHGDKELLSATSVEAEMGVECDYIVHLPVGGAKKASTIRDALTGNVLR